LDGVQKAVFGYLRTDACLDTIEEATGKPSRDFDETLLVGYYLAAGWWKDRMPSVINRTKRSRAERYCPLLRNIRNLKA
jgi:hypothetical protein